MFKIFWGLGRKLTTVSKTNSMNFDKCYFRYVQNESKVDITFLYKNKNLTRQLNFSRKSTETLSNVLVRIKNSVQKVYKKANKKKSIEPEDIEVTVFDDTNIAIPPESTCLDLFSWDRPLKLKITDTVYEITFNTPWVVNLNLPQSILAGFPVYPENFITQDTEKQKNVFHWYRGLSVNEKGNTIGEVHMKWELIGTGFTYMPSAQDVGMKLKLECVPGNSKTTGPAVEVISKNVIEAGPGKCPFETRHMFTTTKLKGNLFRCVSYNILADLYCDSDYTREVLHPYCPPYALHIDYRKQLIVKELMGYNADLICLQEVDMKIFNNCLSPILSSQGLEGLFFKKGKEVSEGLACFYRKDRFSVLGQEQILLSEALKTKSCLLSIWDAIKENTVLLERLLNRSTVASVTQLRSNENPDDIFIVANTHLYFHPDADHIRLLQGGIVIYWLCDIRKRLMKENRNKRVSLIFCGDFNSVPSCGIYQLFTTGVAPSSLSDWKSIQDSEKTTKPIHENYVLKPSPEYKKYLPENRIEIASAEREIIAHKHTNILTDVNEAIDGLSLQQDICLASACGTPPFTNFTVGFADCLDYIFYDQSTLQVEQVVPLPSLEELQQYTALPSIVFPSDHISLVCDLKII